MGFQERWLRELILTGEQDVCLRFPNGTQAKTVRLLAAEKVVRTEQVGRYLEVSVLSILDHEVIVLE
jgi:hypothetical protein